jgi:hypothetical protein
MELISDAVQDHFEQNVTWALSGGVRAEIAALFEDKPKE